MGSIGSRGFIEGIRDPDFPPAREATGRRVGAAEVVAPEAVAPPPPLTALVVGEEDLDGDS